LLRRSLERDGHQVLTATDGQEGVEVFAAQRGEIDLIIMDLKMPRKSGREALAEIRWIEPEARVIVLSGHLQDGEPLSGAWTAIQKPIDIPEFLHLVKEALPDEEQEG